HRSMEEEEAYQQGMEDEEIMAALAYQQEAMVICPLCKARPLHMHGATIECSCGHFSLHTHHDHVTLEHLAARLQEPITFSRFSSSRPSPQPTCLSRPFPNPPGYLHSINVSLRTNAEFSMLFS
ncbi:unnamed protein product, partial [Closterium sp. NIES-65]